MFSRLKELFQGRTQTIDLGEHGPKPRVDTVVIGDVHGSADVLAELIEKIDRIAPDAARIFVGDYIDRGPQSKQALEMVMEEEDKGAFCLLGNHEVMCLRFLEGDSKEGLRWLRFGGLETLASYDITLTREAAFNEINAAREALAEAMGKEGIAWLQARPLFWKSGNLWVCHAGPNPDEPITSRSEAQFLWGHDRFLRKQRSDDQWVAHGHWAMEQASAKAGRISVDTGAWQSGVLTAAVISTDGQIDFVST